MPIDRIKHNGTEYKITEEDSGWIASELTEEFKPYKDNTSNAPRYRKIGNIVHINGVVSPTVEIAGSSTHHVMFTLPEGFRPSRYMSILCPSYACESWMLTVSNNGEVKFSCARKAGAMIAVTPDAQLIFSAIFVADK